MQKIDKIIDKVNYTAFGKVKRKVGSTSKTNIENPITNEKLLEAQRIEIESQLKRVETIKESKGKTAAVFDLLSNVRGGKRQDAELVAMKHPGTGELILEPKQLKDAALEYCTSLLQNDDCAPNFEHEIFVENILHK